MVKKDWQFIAASLIIILVLEGLSFLSFLYPVLSGPFFIALSLLILALSFYRLEFGLLGVLGELFIGSMGHLFVMNVFGLVVPIRMVFWCAVVFAYVFKIFQQTWGKNIKGSFLKNWQSFQVGKYYYLVFFFIVVAIFWGLFNRHGASVVFQDFNAWLYLLLIFPAVGIYQKDNEAAWRRLRLVFMAGAIWLSVETLALLFIFARNLPVAPSIYLWLRRSIVGEMTPTGGGWPRVFIQGQIYVIFALLLIFWSRAKNFFKAEKGLLRSTAGLILSGLFFSTVFISFSRSFWVGLAMTIIFSLGAMIYFYSFKKIWLAISWLLASALIGFGLIYFTAIFQNNNSAGFSQAFLARISNGQESAISSRWALLPVLLKEINRNPLVGQGFGATVTYISHDPRVLEKDPSGLYTTYAFEWGYLDLLLKFGALGTIAYCGLIFIIGAGLWHRSRRNSDPVFLGVLASLIFLAVTNIFTPYLNHPLGLGAIIISSCLILRDRVY